MEPPVGEQPSGIGLEFDDGDVESVVPPEVLLKKFKAIVDLRKTPERLRFRRNAIVLSVVSSVIVLLMLVFWRPEWFSMNSVDLSFLDVAHMDNNPLILIYFVFIAFTAVLGLLSPMYSFLAPIFLVSLLLFTDSFTLYSENFSIHYSCVGPMWYAGILTGVLCVVITIISVGFMNKSLSPDGHRVKDGQTSAVNWIHSILKRQRVLAEGWQLSQCLFGEHLLSVYPDKVAVLEQRDRDDAP